MRTDCCPLGPSYLGKGGFAVVYAIKDRGTGEVYAAKVQKRREFTLAQRQ